MTATYPAAVISVLISAANTLDHHQTLGINYLFFSLGNLFPQLNVGEYLVVFSIKVFGGFVYIGAYGDDGGTMFYLF